MLKVVDKIEQQTQPSPNACVVTCLAMALGIPVMDLIKETGIPVDRGFNEAAFAVWLAERGIWMRPMVFNYGTMQRLLNDAVYLIGVRSLNIVNSDHCVLLDTRPPRKEGPDYNERSGWRTYDPNVGREGIKVYGWVDEYTAIDGHELCWRRSIYSCIGRQP